MIRNKRFHNKTISVNMHFCNPHLLTFPFLLPPFAPAPFELSLLLYIK